MNWKIIWKSLGRRDMQRRLAVVIGILLVYRFLAHVPIPLSDPQTLRQVLTNLYTSNSSQLLNFINVISGNALANFSIMLIGLGPFINASIIMQLLTKAIPRLEKLQKEGEFGQKKINQITRILTLPLAMIQSVGMIFLVSQIAGQVGGVGNIAASATISQWILMVAAITGGAMLLMWLGEQVTEQSVGNGISLLITVSIISALPGMFEQLGHAIFATGGSWNIFGWVTLPVNATALGYSAAIVAAIIIITWLVVKLNEGARNLTVNYAKRVQGNRAYGGVTTTLPVKLITAGVIPIIFAVAFLSVPSFVGKIFSGSTNVNLQNIGQHLTLLFQAPSAQTFAAGGWQPYVYPVTYFLLVFVFTFFYTNIAFNAKDIAENLNKQGGFIEGVRGGAQTEKYLSRLVNRLTFFGAISLGLLAIVPIIAQVFINANIAIGGTSILILVAVSLQTLRAIESRALMITYDQYSSADFFHDSLPLNPEPKDKKQAKKGRRLSLKSFSRKKS